MVSIVSFRLIIYSMVCFSIIVPKVNAGDEKKIARGAVTKPIGWDSMKFGTEVNPADLGIIDEDLIYTPKLIGKNINRADEIMKYLEGYTFAYKVVGHVKSNRPSGEIIKQDPAENAMLHEKPITVKVIVSAGQ